VLYCAVTIKTYELQKIRKYGSKQEPYNLLYQNPNLEGDPPTLRFGGQGANVFDRGLYQLGRREPGWYKESALKDYYYI
jgi:hypothetical protein